MKYRCLGNNGLRVSEVTLGNWLTHAETVDRDAALACVRAALDVGITTFDTADVYAYGAAESLLGEALRGVRRDSVEIATKVCLRVGDGPNDRGLSRKHIMESCHASLQRLGTDYVDLYQAHRYDDETPLEETLVAFDDLVRKGKVRYLGVSEWTAAQLRSALDLAAQLSLRSRIVSNQPQYNMLWRVIEPEVLPLCEKEGLGLAVFQPLAQGVLSGKYRPGQPPPDGSRGATPGRAQTFVGRVLGDAVLERLPELRPLAGAAGLSLAQLAIAWTLNRPGVSTAVTGATRPEQVRENAGAAGVRIAADVMRRIDDILGDLIDTDPTKTARMMAVKPGWSRNEEHGGR